MNQAVTILLRVVILTTLALCTGLALADVDTQARDSKGATPIDQSSSDESKSADELVEEAQNLLAAGNPIDARSKLLKAVQLAPKDYRPKMVLGSYYLAQVGHFRLALKYLLQAEELMRDQFGADSSLATDPEHWKDHARLLYFLSEAQLNLDDYQASLDTLDRFASFYWDDWYPGSRAWVLMKLKRVDEAIRVAQAGLLRGAELGRTYNILGILLSLKDNRKLALQAFGKAIRAERAMGGFGQPATPLNNAGEVYREIFQDDLAEAAFLQALRLRDGCDHILPSLNLTILYVDQLRLFQAERVLDDFVSCFAQQSERSDTEHRALLALARGRIALHKGETAAAERYLNQAIDREQWFGKIGTNENDVRLAAASTLAMILEFHRATLADHASASVTDSISTAIMSNWAKFRSAWYFRKAREVALTELNNFEDLRFRNTDTMIEYPTLGQLLKTFPQQYFDARFKRLMREERRDDAKVHYQLYRAINLLQNGTRDDAIKLLEQTRTSLREIDRLARAQATAFLIRAYIQKHTPIWPLNLWINISEQMQRKIDTMLDELFTFAPAYVRLFDLQLPVVLAPETGSVNERKLASRLVAEVTRIRFTIRNSELNLYLKTSCQERTDTPESADCTLSLLRGDKHIASISKRITDTRQERASMVNEFIDKVFSHRVDPAPAAIPKLELLEADDALG